ncbi:uncharacterized protein METZ01_LOCUS451534 [marine metagenome]|uniref:Deoxynucleotide monophosphate kinase n=1 Tax=marine metagenome TaxID=408172 RepID=A0A382ZTR6_9ZZZZ
MVIGISGKIRSGKSRVAKTIIEILEKNGKTGVVKSFAEPIYKMISEMYESDIESIKKHKQDNTPIYIKTPRTFLRNGYKSTNYRTVMQIIGSGVRNYADNDVWVNGLFGVDNEKINNSDSVWIIEDLRFPNEAERIRDCNGLLIRIEREMHQPNDHIIENSLNDWHDWDLLIENNFKTKKKRNKGLKKILENYLTGVVV